jgi:hypothetical protein
LPTETSIRTTSPPHSDTVESFLKPEIATEKINDLVEFDGSVVVNRTGGELSARCHDEKANFLDLNLASDIIEGEKTVKEAREYCKHEFLAYRKKEPTPYMEGLRFEPNGRRDADERVLSDEELQQAERRARLSRTKEVGREMTRFDDPERPPFCPDCPPGA